MSTDQPLQSASTTDPPTFDISGPLGLLPRLSGRAVGLRRSLEHGTSGFPLRESLRWLTEPLGPSLQVGALEIDDRPTALRRAGVVARIGHPARSSRLAVGLEAPLAHALIDRLLGFARLAGEEHLQITPVEWGVLSCIVARTLTGFSTTPDLVLDRIGLEPFDPEGLGPVVTLRWPLRLGAVTGTLRVWIPESLLRLATHDARPDTPDPADLVRRFGMLTGTWKAEAGTITLPRGTGRLRVGGVQPIDQAPLRGTPASPTGPIELVLRTSGRHCAVPVACAPLTAGGRIVVIDRPFCEPKPREALAVTPTDREDLNPQDPGTPAQASGSARPGDVPVTLVVELGRINLPVMRVAELKPGDVLELSRHAREPVELTSAGKLVARGELVQIDTELGVRITHVFL